MKKSFIYIIALATILTTGCSKVGKIMPDDDELNGINNNSSSQAEVTTIEEIEPDVPQVESVAFSQKLEAELAQISGDLKRSQVRKGYSGTGYVTNFTAKTENNFQLSVTVPSNQHYDITLVLASDKKENNILTVNGKDVAEFVTSGKQGYNKITITGVFIPKGQATLGIHEVTGGIDLDYISVTNCEEIQQSAILPDGVPINKSADQKTKNTMLYLADNYNNNVLSGQYATMGTNTELEAIYKATGKYPAIRLGDMRTYTSNSLRNIREVDQAILWAKKGGLVSYVWNWEAPMNESSCFTKETKFDFKKAVSKTNIAQLSIEDIEKLYDKGEISEECVAIVKDIDSVSAQLARLQENGVTVLWRPLHEASGGWFWWGSAGKDSYQWLWKLMYERQTYYHKLNNLIWVWNCHDASWYVGDDKCDIISADVYTGIHIPSSQINTFLNFTKISSSKMIALSECDTVPDVNCMLRDKAMWSWFGVWSGEYMIDQYGELSEKYTSKDQLIKTYNHKNVITLDKLPDLNIWVS